MKEEKQYKIEVKRSKKERRTKSKKQISTYTKMVGDPTG
jgi:hypothetical protein